MFQLLICYLLVLGLSAAIWDSYRDEKRYNRFIHYILSISFILLLTYVLYQIT